MYKVLAANEELTLDTKESSTLLLARFEGEIQYSVGKPIDISSWKLNATISTDVVSLRYPNDPVYIKAGAAGATIQYRLE